MGLERGKRLLQLQARGRVWKGGGRRADLRAGLTSIAGTEHVGTPGRQRSEPRSATGQPGVCIRTQSRGEEGLHHRGTELTWLLSPPEQLLLPPHKVMATPGQAMGQHPLGGKAGLENIRSVTTCNVREAGPEHNLNSRTREEIRPMGAASPCQGEREKGLSAGWA